MPGKRSSKKTAVKKRGVQSFFNLRNRKFVVLLVLILGFASYGSYKLYSTSAYTSKRAYPTVKECYAFKPYLYEGVGGQGACVKTLQDFLNHVRVFYGSKLAIWPSLSVDGAFGPRTKLAVTVFQGQTDRIITADGKVGPQTWDKIQDQCWKFQPTYGLAAWCGYYTSGSGPSTWQGGSAPL